MSGSKSSVDSWTGFVPRQCEARYYLDLLSMGCDRLNYDIKVRYNTLDLTQYESCSHEERLCLTTHGV